MTLCNQKNRKINLIRSSHAIRFSIRVQVECVASTFSSITQGIVFAHSICPDDSSIQYDKTCSSHSQTLRSNIASLLNLSCLKRTHASFNIHTKKRRPINRHTQHNTKYITYKTPHDRTIIPRRLGCRVCVCRASRVAYVVYIVFVLLLLHRHIAAQRARTQAPERLLKSDRGETATAACTRSFKSPAACARARAGRDGVVSVALLG